MFTNFFLGVAVGAALFGALSQHLGKAQALGWSGNIGAVILGFFAGLALDQILSKCLGTAQSPRRSESVAAVLGILMSALLLWVFSEHLDKAQALG